MLPNKRKREREEGGESGDRGRTTNINIKILLYETAKNFIRKSL